MRILVTGHRGNVGVSVATRLRALGHDVAGFDLADGQDLLDAVAVRRAADGCSAIVHLGAIANDSGGSPEQIMAVNVLGTWHALLAAESAGVARIVSFSSMQVFGTAEGEQLPDYFPIDDDHPRRAMRPYGLSKRLAEELCDGFSARSGIPVVSLRPVHVWGPDFYQTVEQRRRADPAAEWQPHWEYGAFVDARDVATAVERALSVPTTGHVRAVLCAADIAGSAPALELAARLAPGVPVTQAARYAADPWQALVDCSVARDVLGWRPAYTWSGRGRRAPPARSYPEAEALPGWPVGGIDQRRSSVTSTCRVRDEAR